MQAALEDDGVEIVLSSIVERVGRDGDEVVATIIPMEGEGSRDVRVTTVLLASGRAPNVESLHLDELGIDHDRLGIDVDDRLRTSVDGIWAAGDVTGHYQFTPIAQYQARIAVDDMFGANPLPADYSVLPTAIFTEPELAGVGMTEEEARDEGLDFGTAVHDIEHVQRSSYKDQKRGLYKLLYEQGSRRLIGLHVVAPNGSEIVQGLSLALRFETTVDDLARMHHVFPTFGEGVKAAAEQALPQPVEMATICN